jgi:acyl-CoA reductase-like NAD-dependent aldehyde dehydrogenase
LEAPDEELLRQECFGPISFLVAVPDAEHATALAERLIRSEGALTLAGYTTDAAFEERLVRLSLRARVALSLNLTHSVYVNQAAAFSDFHGSGGNPAANASYTGLAFVADRFVVVQRRWHVQPETPATPATAGA